ncbi:MAG: peptidoglycan -binding protein [Paracoccaceae bacterium]
MALVRRGSQKMAGTIWPGFVDAMTALLLVLMFVLSIFMIVQSVLRETITSQDNELDALTEQIVGLADALGLERNRADEAESEVGALSATLTATQVEAESQAALISSLTGQLSVRDNELAAARGRIASFEEQVAGLLADRQTARDEAARLTASLDELETARQKLITEQEAMQLALAQARDEIDAQTEEARLAAARREALDALVADLRARAAERQEALQAAETRLSEAEKNRLADAAAAEALRAKLQSAGDELTAMTLALEEQRKKAEDTLTLLAAADVARKDLDLKLAAALVARDEKEAALQDALAEAERLREAAGSDPRDIERELAAALAAKLAAELSAEDVMSRAEEQAALLSVAQKALSDEQAKSAESQRRMALLNEQIAALRTQLGSLQGLLDAAADRDSDARVQIEALGSRLNSALAQVASEQRRRAELEEAERIRLEEEARLLKDETKQLERYRSEFFGKLRDVLAGREGVQVVGDRFVFSSEVLFEPASADLSAEGRAQIARVAAILSEVSGQIPPEIDWVIRVDGHTDNVPLSGTGKYADNWELSQGRALSVVRYMIDALGFPPNRLAATGFGEFRPVAEGDSPEALAANRRIEMKLTER